MSEDVEIPLFVELVDNFELSDLLLNSLSALLFFTEDSKLSEVILLVVFVANFVSLTGALVKVFEFDVVEFEALLLSLFVTVVVFSADSTLTEVKLLDKFLPDSFPLATVLVDNL